jgi:cardiolipin synthase
VLLVIIEQQWLPALHSVVTMGIWAVVASVLYSGFEYVIIWGNKAWKQRKQP